MAVPFLSVPPLAVQWRSAPLPGLMAERSAHLLTESHSDAVLATSSDTLRLGYVPLTDAAPLLIAQAKGFFRAQGIAVSLTAVASWASLRDRIAFGVLDGAQMLSPMPIAATLGLGGVQTDLVVAATLGRNGNTITFGEALAGEIAAAADPAIPVSAARLGMALADVLAARRTAGGKVPVLAVVFPFSSHNYLMRHWLAEAGIDPEHDIRLVVVPPPQVADALAAGAIDGFCAGEPWGSRAVDLRVGRILLATGDIWPNHPEKVLALTARAARDTDRAAAAIAAVIEAGAWLDRPDNRSEAAHILARALPSVPEEVVGLALNGLRLAAPDSAPVIAPKLIFSRDGASYPFPAHGAWWLGQMRRWGHVPEGTEETIIDRIWCPELWRHGAARTGEPVPAADIATFNLSTKSPGVAAR